MIGTPLAQSQSPAHWPRPRTIRASRRCRAFATLIAITLIAFVATTLTALSFLFATEVRRTRDAADDAQLQQLLLAGAVVVQSQAAAWPAQPPAFDQDLPLPPSLAADGAAAHLLLLPNSPPGRATCRITARLGSHHAAQRLTFTRTNNAWHLTQANLE
jgi:hypothetical protein